MMPITIRRVLPLILLFVTTTLVAQSVGSRYTPRPLPPDSPKYLRDLYEFAQQHTDVEYPPVTGDWYGVPPTDWTQCPSDWKEAADASLESKLVGMFMQWTVGHMYSMRIYRTEEKSICAILDAPERRLLTGAELELYENAARLALRVTERNIRDASATDGESKSANSGGAPLDDYQLPDVPPAPMLRIDLPPVESEDESC